MAFSQEFEPLDPKRHAIKEFDCGIDEMNKFLKKFAQKHAKQGISKTMVLTTNEHFSDKKEIAVYYTLSASTVKRKDIPSTSLPTYPIPVTMLARLAVNQKFQGKKLGTKSLIYALRHAVKLNDLGLSTHGLILDALDDNALKFYQKFDFFHPLPGNPLRLFVSMTELRKI
ncbi:GNAT family N-acetyltransferase [Legionella israelensis]|uniref:GNAT family N-acetyltransferase n=1 Tax=Legionella israelensis TaxID=454 RepID=A0AAX1EFA9_9GAMM|nr:GNAT family N-acetyltransferase [Legionella israelensis]QBR83786.1 GNAT family N-acetyltransferase [Legionella israelensis]